MRVEGSVTTVSWIPSEAVTGAVYRVPFEVGMAHYDDPPPPVLDDVDGLIAADRARFVNQLKAWAEVSDGVIGDYGHAGEGRIGSTTLRLAGVGMAFAAVQLSDRRTTRRLSESTVVFEQTVGGRTGVPAPRRVRRPPYLQIAAPLAWSTLRLTLHADGRAEAALVGASPFPRHWVYDSEGRLVSKSARIDYREWSNEAFGDRTPWGDIDSPALTTEVETALERELSAHIMRAGVPPKMRRLRAGEKLTEQHEHADDLFLLLDGVLRVEVDGNALAEIGPGAILGERAVLEGGRRTASLTAVTPCLVAVAEPAAIDPDLLRQVASGHRRELDQTEPS